MRSPKPQFLFGAVLAFLALGSAANATTVEGFTEPYRTIAVAAGEPGVITEVLVVEGQAVKQGQLLIRLDTAVLEAALAVARLRADAKGPLQAAEAEVKLRENRLNQLAILREKGHATRRELNRAETDLAVSQARLVATREELAAQVLECKRIEAQIDRRNVRSPVDGFITEVHREVGESYIAVEPVLVTMVQLDRLRVKLAVDENNATHLKVGETVKLSLPEIQQKATGKIETISPITDAKSATTKFVVVIENQQGKVRSGTRCLLPLPGTKSNGLTHEVSKTRAKSH